MLTSLPAATSSFTDKTGDAAAGVDLRSVEVVDGTENVWVTTTHRDLVPGPSSEAGGTVYLDTDPADKGPEYALVAGYFDGTDYLLVRVEGWHTAKGPSEPVECSYAGRLDHDAETVRSRFARGCFGGADLRVEVRVSGATESGGTAVDRLGRPRTFSATVPRG